MNFDDLPKLRTPNPLPCGCAIMGIPGINLEGTHAESRDLHIKFCLMHDSAKEMLAAFELAAKLVSDIDQKAWYGGSEIPEIFRKIDTAIAKAKGEPT